MRPSIHASGSIEPQACPGERRRVARPGPGGRTPGAEGGRPSPSAAGLPTGSNGNHGSRHRLNVLIAITASWWAQYARVVRSAVLAEREKPYIEAARALGAPTRRIIVRQLLPNIVAPLLVLTTLDLGAILLGISAISFLGLGV